MTHPLYDGSSSPAAPASPAGTSPATTIWTSAILLATALLAFAPVIVMAPVTGWPASLGYPAAQQLGLVVQHDSTIRLGYGLYLLYSVLVFPAMALLAHHVLGGLHRPVAAVVVGLAALSALARSIGILRWLTVMPELAARHAAAGADSSQRAAIELVFTAVTEYGGGIGEVLGVSLFMAAAVGVLAIASGLARSLPLWLSGIGLVSALMLAALSLPVFGAPEVMPVAVAVTTVSVWMLIVAVWLWLRRGTTTRR